MAASSSVFLQFRHVVKSGGLSGNLFTRLTNRMNNVCLHSTATDTVVKQKTENSSTKSTSKNISKAMLAYLERAHSHDVFIQQEKEDYQIGKRHLANMMGEDPEHFTQKDIDNAIEYLFPSGLYDKAARPLMKPPEVIFPPRKAAEFDETGRPYHSLFYTTQPNYYQTLYDVYEELEKLNALEDEMIKKGIPPNPHNDVGLLNSDWLTYERFQQLILEEIQEADYVYFISSIQRLADHPYAYNVKDFLMKYRIPRKALTQSFTIPPLEHDSDGRPFITVPDCMRKTTRGTVTIRGKGSGIITVNGKSLINYFPSMQDREQVIFPLHFAGVLDEVDVEATVRLGGPTGHAGAIRWGIAWGLRSFVDMATIEKMRVAGLLTRDWRRRERKKPGQEGARRKFTWKKR